MVTGYLLMCCRVAIGLVFAVSVLGKVRALADFEAAIVGFRLLPARWSGLAARGLLAGEACVVLLLAVGGAALPVGFALALVLLVGFALALALVLRAGHAPSCNCFGASPRRISPYDVVRNLLLVLVCAGGLFALNRPAERPDDVALVLAGLLAAGGVALIINLGDVVETVRRPLT